MFSKIIALFAILAVAFAAPSPKPAPEPSPQYISYSGADYLYPAGAVVNPVVSPYAAVVNPYSTLTAPYYVR